MMNKFLRKAPGIAAIRRGTHTGEKGEVILMTLAFMLLGFLLIVPLVSYMGTGLKAGMVNNSKTASLYSADAGVEDAMWQIKYDHLSGTFANDDPPYDAFDYLTPCWQYTLPRVGGSPRVKRVDVEIRIDNEWMPKDIPAPTKATAHAIVETGKSARFLVTGGAFGTTSFNLVLTYTAQTNENLYVDKIGIWLPPGSPTTATAAWVSNCSRTSRTIRVAAIMWTFASPVLFTSLPGVKTTDSPMTASIPDYATQKSGARPDAVAWAITEGVDLDNDGISWGTTFPGILTSGYMVSPP